MDAMKEEVKARYEDLRFRLDRVMANGLRTDEEAQEARRLSAEVMNCWKS